VSVPVASGGTGLTAIGTALQVLRVNAAATGLEYATIATGGGATNPGGTSGQIQVNSGGAFGGIDFIAVARGGTGLVALPTANQLLGVNAGATAYEGKTLTAGTNVTITPGAGTITIAATVSGGATPPGGTSGQIQVNSSGSFGGISSVPTTQGGTGLIVLPSANQLLGVNAGATAYEGKTLAAGANVTITPSAGALTIASSGGAGGITPQWSLTGIAGQKTGVTPVTIFSGGTYAIAGSLTIPANRLVTGSMARISMFGDLTTTTAGTVTMIMKLGGLTLLMGTSNAWAVGVNGRQWQVRDCELFVLAGGVTGAIRSAGALTVAATDSTTHASIYMSTTGGGAASTAVAFDFTAPLAFDCLVNFDTANAGNLFRILGGVMTIVG